MPRPVGPITPREYRAGLQAPPLETDFGGVPDGECARQRRRRHLAHAVADDGGWMNVVRGELATQRDLKSATIADCRNNQLDGRFQLLLGMQAAHEEA